MNPSEPPAYVGDELPALLAGDCDRAQTLAVAAHLRTCPPCRDELVSVALATGTLRAAARAERDVLAPAGPVSPADVPADVPADGPADGPGATPDWLTSSVRSRQRLGGRRRLALAAASVIILAGAAAAAIGLSASGSPVVARATLHPLQAPASASADITVTSSSGGRLMVVRTSGLPAPGRQHFYEVWLLDPVTLKMMPMGTLPPSGQASYGVSASLMAGYSAVDISLQANNGNPAHPAVSVLRGSLAAGPPSA